MEMLLGSFASFSILFFCCVFFFFLIATTSCFWKSSRNPQTLKVLLSALLELDSIQDMPEIQQWSLFFQSWQVLKILVGFYGWKVILALDTHPDSAEPFKYFPSKLLKLVHCHKWIVGMLEAASKQVYVTLTACLLLKFISF